MPLIMTTDSAAHRPAAAGGRHVRGPDLGGPIPIVWPPPLWGRLHRPEIPLGPGLVLDQARRRTLPRLVCRQVQGPARQDHGSMLRFASPKGPRIRESSQAEPLVTGDTGDSVGMDVRGPGVAGQSLSDASAANPGTAQCLRLSQVCSLGYQYRWARSSRGRLTALSIARVESLSPWKNWRSAESWKQSPVF